jgi:hypothetical protein
MGRQLNARQALKPFPKGIIGRRVSFPHQAVGQRLLEDFRSGASRVPSQSVAQQLFSLRCEGNLHESTIAQAGMERTGNPSNRQEMVSATHFILRLHCGCFETSRLNSSPNFCASFV